MTGRLRLGRMARWQRYTTYVVLALCAASGVLWFVALDVLHQAPPEARPWWILHGTTALLAALTIGGAIAQHVIVTWRGRRARWIGSANLALLAVLMATALYLMYGADRGRDAVHWVHCVVGIVAIAGFVGHVLWGKTRVARLPRGTGHAKPR